MGARPFFDFRDHVDGHIDRAGFGLLFEGQVSAWGAAAWALEGAEGTLKKRANGGDALERSVSAGGVPVLGHGMVRVHIGSI